jgi:hypothetical protein
VLFAGGNTVGTLIVCTGQPELSHDADEVEIAGDTSFSDPAVAAQRLDSISKSVSAAAVAASSAQTAAVVESISRLVNGPTVQRHYRFPTNHKAKLKVTEYLGESIYFLTVPLQFMAMAMTEDKKTMRTLEELGQLLGPAEMVRLELNAQAISRVNTYLERTAFLDSYTAATFKPSLFKKHEFLDMLPINCHIQRMKVSGLEDPPATAIPSSSGVGSSAQGLGTGSVAAAAAAEAAAAAAAVASSKDNPVLYDTITHGAPSAHTLGYKNGGLRHLLEERAALMPQCYLSVPPELISGMVDALTELRGLRDEIDGTAGHVMVRVSFFFFSFFIYENSPPTLLLTFWRIGTSQRVRGRSQRRHSGA